MSGDTVTVIFTKLRSKFQRYASQYFETDDEVEDALQDAFCKLWVRRHTINSRSEAEAMATTIVKNLGIDSYRHKKVIPMVELDSERDGSLTDSVAEQMEKKELFASVDKIISTQLSESQSTILRLRDFEGEEFAEIAKKLDMQETAVRMQLSRARKIVRECYQKNKQL